MPLDERNVPLPPDNDGCRGDSPVTSHSLRVGLHLSLRDIVSRTRQEG
jgi:hypothetical protein